MPLLETTVDEAILAVVNQMSGSVNYKVYDGIPTKLPDTRTVTKYLVVGAETLDDRENFTSMAHMEQQWVGLGQVARDEVVFINCVATGVSTSIAGARANAKAILDDIRNHMSPRLSTNTYNALIEQVTSVKAKNAHGGAIVQMEFIISANARIRDA